MIPDSKYTDSSIVAEAFDLAPSYVNRPDRGFYLRLADDSLGKVLELGCGTGRILIPIAASGHTITGVDISEHMLSRCRQKLKSLSAQVQEKIQLHPADMAEFKLNDLFRLAIIPCHGFQHMISVKEQMNCFNTINRHLVMKSKLAFDVVNVDFNVISNLKNMEEVEALPECSLPDGRRLKQTGRIAGFHRTEQYNDVELIYYLTDLNGKTERIVHSFPYRYFFRYEIEHLLELCGFRVVELYGNFDRSPLADNSPEMIFVAEKYREISKTA